jgi:hypothetical protein
MGWQDSKAAIDMRDAIFNVAVQAIDRKRPAASYATVSSINRTDRTCQLLFPGSTVPVTIAMGSIQPSAIGQVVRVNGVDSDRYVEDVLGDAYFLGKTNKQILPPLSIGGALAIQTGKIRFYAPWPYDITNVGSSVGTAPTTAATRFDVNKNGTTIFTNQANRPSIAIGTFLDSSSVPDVTHFAVGDYLTVDVDVTGNATDGIIVIEYT